MWKITTSKKDQLRKHGVFFLERRDIDMEGLEPIEETYQFKSRNMLNERITVNVHFYEHIATIPIVKQRFILYCTICVKSASKRLQYYHGGTVWNGQDVFDRNDAIFKAFKDTLVRRFSGECCENENIDGKKFLSGQTLAIVKSRSMSLKSAWEAYSDGWCAYFWEVINGATNGNHPNFF